MQNFMFRQERTAVFLGDGNAIAAGMSRKALLGIAVFAAVLLIPWRSAAQVGVQATVPAHNSMHIDPATPITITFSAAIDPSTAAGSALVLLGSLHGYYGYTGAYDAATHTLTLTPDAPFRRGERVTVICSASIQSAAGPAITPFLLQFTVAYDVGGTGFVPGTSTPAGTAPTGLGMADLDGDGDADLVVTDGGPSSVLIYENTGTGLVLRASVTVGAQPLAELLAAGDFDRDGDIDLAIPCSGAGRIFYVWNDGTWSFHTSSYYIGGLPTCITAGDMDRDGDLDLLVTNRYNMKLMRNIGTGLFTTYSTTMLSGSPYATSLADIDADGDLDVAVTRSASGMVVFYRNTGLGGLQYAGTVTTGNAPGTLECGDFDADGDMDFVVANGGSEYVSLLTNDGSGSFGSTQIPVGVAQQRALPFDADGDGDADLLLSSGQLLLNDGSAGFSAGPSALAPGIPLASDLDGDGDADVAVLDAAAAVILPYRNDVSNAAPTADAGPDFTAACSSSSCSATVSLDGSASSDPDSDPLTYTWEMNGIAVAGPSPGSSALLTLAPGTHQVTLRVTDPDGAEDTDVVSVQVVDVTPPQVSVTLSPSVLWPPNHQLRPVTASVTVSDNCGASFTLLSIVSNEAESGLSKKDKGDDIQGESLGTPDTAFELRAERGGSSDRIYTVTYRAVDAAGNSALASGTVTVPHDMAKRLIAAETIPDALSLAQNYPNPFNPVTHIEFGVPEAAPVRLDVFDLYGRHVATLVDDMLDAGSYDILFDATGQPSGTYLCRLQSGRTILSRRITLLK